MSATYQVLRLKTDVKNPEPDGRSQKPESMKVWPKGTIFLVVRRKETIDIRGIQVEREVGYMKFIDVPGNYRNGLSIPLADPQTAALLAADSEPVVEHLGALAEVTGTPVSYILAILVETGKVKWEDVAEAAREMRDDDSAPGTKFDRMVSKHGL